MRYLLVLVVACAPVVDGPVERQRAADRADAATLTGQLSALPGVVRAEVLLRRAAIDPLDPLAHTTPASSIVIIVDDKTDRAAIATTARALSRAATPELESTIVVEVGATRPELAKVGPFTVEAGSRTPLRAVLAIALVAIIALAGWLAITSRRRSGSARRTGSPDPTRP